MEAEAPLQTWKDRARGLLDGLGGEPAIVIYAGSALLIVSHYQGSAGFWRSLVGARFDTHPWAGALGYLWWFGSSFVLYLVMPLVVSFATKGSFHERYGFQWGDWKEGLKISALFLAVMLPATYVASKLDSFKGIYPLAGNSAFMENLGGGKTSVSWKLFLVYEAGYMAYFFAWEFLFRGWMVNGLVPKWGRAQAILVQVMPFAVMHLGKAELEALGSIVAGVALGILAVRTRSFFYGFFLHGAVAFWMDWLSVHDKLLNA